MVDRSDIHFWLLVSVVFLIGMISGFIISYFVVLHGIEVIGTSFTVENVNVTVGLNNTMIVEAMQEAVNRSSSNDLSSIDLADGLIK